MLKLPTELESYKIIKEPSAEGRKLPFYERNSSNSSEEIQMDISKRNQEQHNKFFKSSNTFYKRALRGDALGQKAMNDIKLRNQCGSQRSDSNDSTQNRGQNTSFRFNNDSKPNPFNRWKESDKENQGFRANQPDRKQFESPHIDHKGHFSNVNRGFSTVVQPNTGAERGISKESKIARLRNQHDEYLKSNNL